VKQRIIARRLDNPLNADFAVSYTRSR